MRFGGGGALIQTHCGGRCNGGDVGLQSAFKNDPGAVPKAYWCLEGGSASLAHQGPRTMHRTTVLQHSTDSRRAQNCTVAPVHPPPPSGIHRYTPPTPVRKAGQPGPGTSVDDLPQPMAKPGPSACMTGARQRRQQRKVVHGPPSTSLAVPCTTPTGTPDDQHELRTTPSAQRIRITVRSVLACLITICRSMSSTCKHK